MSSYWTCDAREIAWTVSRLLAYARSISDGVDTRHRRTGDTYMPAASAYAQGGLPPDSEPGFNRETRRQSRRLRESLRKVSCLRHGHDTAHLSIP